MHIVEVFGRIFISLLFILEGIRKIFNPDMSMMYMSEYGVPEILFYPSVAFEIIVPLILIAGYKTKIMAFNLDHYGNEYLPYIIPLENNIEVDKHNLINTIFSPIKYKLDKKENTLLNFAVNHLEFYKKVLEHE